MANLWTISIDDSGDADKRVFIIAGCLIGNKTHWSAFHKAWRKELHAKPRVEYFHQKEFTSHMGEFFQFFDKSKWPSPLGYEAAGAKRTSLLRVIAESPLKCYAMLLRVPEYEEVRGSSDKAKRYLDEDPWAYLIQELAFDTAKMVVQVDPKATIAFMAGHHEKYVRYERFYEDFKKSNDVIAEHLDSITHGDYKKLYSLQAADLIASESKKCFEKTDRSESEEEIFKKHPILSSFVGFNGISKDRLAKVVELQGTRQESRLLL
ncbi:MAG TPA: DUF3800 domain-containing protein [Terracidiphilus sp.]